jgi:hypothetical protein
MLVLLAMPGAAACAAIAGVESYTIVDGDAGTILEAGLGEATDALGGGGGPDASCTGDGGLCGQVVECDGGATTVSGTVYAPNGVEPVPGALVYVPNCALSNLSPSDGGAQVSCERCGAVPSGCPVTSVVAGADGTFTLTGVPSGTNDGKGIPLVVQLGHWRRQISIPSVTACQDNGLTDRQTHLPTRSTASIASGACATNVNDPSDQGDIPLVAMATGSGEEIECALRKIGVDDCEFTSPPPIAPKPGRVQFYLERGPDVDASAPGANSPTADAPDWADPKNGLIQSVSRMKSYDMIFFSCEGQSDGNVVPFGSGGTTNPIDGTSSYQQNFYDYAAAGGRVYTAHYSYTWMTNIQAGTSPPANGPTPLSSVASWNVHQNDPSPQVANIDTTLPDGGPFLKGQQFVRWLGLPGVNALTNFSPPQIQVDNPRNDVASVNIPPAEQWIHLPGVPADIPQHMVFNVPLQGRDGGTTAPCGRVLYLDMHAQSLAMPNPTTSFPHECDSIGTSCANTVGNACPRGTHASSFCSANSPCLGNTMSAAERVLEYMLFDLAACIAM